MIYILTGEIRSGKTTALSEWCKNRNDVDGLLCPDNAEGKRYFLKVKSKNEFELETELDTEDIIKIGNFKFLKSAFDKANEFLISAHSETKTTYLIIDELGKLELKNEGLHWSAERLIPNCLNDKNKHLILVVRNYLVEAIVKHYSITEYRILTKVNLENLN
ncbi:nucleoside-triphosphatase [Winogradskyella helgolandensis]|uniref:nucleoside-triphosphatase n=1 Tax=Winogradskyella helgolandensis TaxID=2697010 RepID=UPI0015B79F64|nr:nucleoside-triphosphatase [Winogradskyella helgolandensis]